MQANICPMKVYSIANLNVTKTSKQNDFLREENKLERLHHQLNLCCYINYFTQGGKKEMLCFPCQKNIHPDTPSLKLIKTKGSIGHAFTVCIHTENQNQVSLCPFVVHEIS